MEEILHQLIGTLPHYLQGLKNIQTVVVWDFSHQQYDDRLSNSNNHKCHTMFFCWSRLEVKNHEKTGHVFSLKIPQYFNP